MENRDIARLLAETADLMEVAAEDGFRIRSYRNAASAIEGYPERVEDIICNPERKVTEIPGIGKGIAAALEEICKRGSFDKRDHLLEQFPPTVLDLLRIQGLGPKGIAVLWEHYKVATIDDLERICKEQKLRELPRMGAKLEEKVLKSIAQYRRRVGRFLLSFGQKTADEMIPYLSEGGGVEKIAAAGSLRRGKETIGDLDLLVTGPGAADALERFVAHPKAHSVLGKGPNKASIQYGLEGLQIDLRALSHESYGAAMQYFTGSKEHNIVLRSRALKLGLTLNEYGLFRLENEQRVAGETEEEVYGQLGLKWIPPELRENCGEVEAAEKGELPELITQADLQGDVHMHTVETDGKCTIEEMAEAARERGYKYMAITDHSKNLAFANGLDDKRAEEHIKKIRKANHEIEGIVVLAGIEVDILAEGDLDLSDSVLEQMDLVIASVHSHFQQEPAQMTDRLLRALSNPNVSIIGHPTGRILLRREGYGFDSEKVFSAAAQAGIALEHNAYPDRLDLRDQHLRRAKSKGAKIVINTDSHHTSHMEKIRYGILQLRRAWLTKQDVLNTLPLAEFTKAMRRGRPVLAET
jgi:DNA polymerase (family 10)